MKSGNVRCVSFLWDKPEILKSDTGKSDIYQLILNNFGYTVYSTGIGYETRDNITIAQAEEIHCRILKFIDKLMDDMDYMKNNKFIEKKGE